MIADSLGGLQEIRPTLKGLYSCLCHLLCDPEQITLFLPASCFLNSREFNVPGPSSGSDGADFEAWCVSYRCSDESPQTKLLKIY